ncbi:MAG: phage head closure protein [Aquabacterium sp.]|nr:phage head closure protein [Aquabacterium sp.]
MATNLPGAGEFNRRVHLCLWSEMPNAAFGLDQTYDPGINRWAKVEPVYSLTIRAGMNTGETPTHLFWLRYGTGTKPADITASHVIEHDGRRYRVMDSIDVDDRRIFTRISAKDLGAI